MALGSMASLGGTQQSLRSGSTQRSLERSQHMSVYMNELNRLKQRKDALLQSKGFSSTNDDNPNEQQQSQAKLNNMLSSSPPGTQNDQNIVLENFRKQIEED